MAKDTINVGLYTSPSGDKQHIAEISLEDAISDITRVQCLYIRNVKDNKVLFMSPNKCRLMGKKTFDALLANKDIVNINYTTLYKNYGKKIGVKSRDICTACYWNTEYEPYIALIKIFYNQALGVSVYDTSTSSTKGSTYEQYSNLMIKGTDKNILQEFFINKEMPAPQQTPGGGWYKQYEDTFFSNVENEYSDVEFGTLISLASFKFHKKADTVTYELVNDIKPITDGSGGYYYRTQLGGYLQYYNNNILESSTGGLFNILNEDFEARFPDFAAKLKLNNKLFAKYTSLREVLMNRENRNKAFLFTVSYQNRHSLCVNEIYDFDLIKKTFDYNGDDFGDELVKISNVIANNNFIKLKMRYGTGAIYLNKDAFTDKGANIDISMSSDNYGVSLNFKNGRHKCSIPVTDTILNELEGSIPEEQLMMLKCELVLRQ